MRKIILTTVAVFGLASPALADMTLPVGAYPQAGGSWAASDEGAPAFNATVEPSTHFSMGQAGRAHIRAYHQR